MRSRSNGSATTHDSRSARNYGLNLLALMLPALGYNGASANVSLWDVAAKQLTGPEAGVMQKAVKPIDELPFVTKNGYALSSVEQMTWGLNLDRFLDFIQANKAYFDAAEAISSVLNLIAWMLAAIILTVAWRRNHITGVSVGPINIHMKAEAIEATTAAVRAWKQVVPSQQVSVPRIRATVDHAFSPTVLDSLVGKAILWVDDNPINNRLAVRALTKLQMEVVQETSTDAGVATFERHPFDLVISDMGRGDNMRAGYDFLGLLRGKGADVPFAIFAGSDTPEFRGEAAALGAQLSTNDMLELIDFVVAQLGKDR